MLKEIMDEILQAEARADEIVADASSRAKEIRQKGESESARIVIAAKKEAAELMASLEKETDAEAAAAEEAVLAQGKRDAAAIRQGAEGKVTDAAQEVRDRVLKKYGVTSL